MKKDAPSQSKREELTSADMDRREFLLAGAAMAAAPLVAPSSEAEPILDIHQHTYYEGRSNAQLIAHQQFHGVTITNLMAGDGWLLSVIGGNADCLALQA